MLAPGKINLALFLGELRGDGLHDLATVTESLCLGDEVTLEAVPGHDSDQVICVGVEGPNLAAAAMAGFRETFGWKASPQRITIEKRLPVAAGMGGGSADAAATLRLCAQAAGVRPDDARLHELAWRLGADVPSQIEPGVAFVTGGGEHVERLAPLPRHGALIVPSTEQLSTADVFSEADRLGLTRSPENLHSITERLRQALAVGELPVELVVNDLEPAVRSLCPAIDSALTAVRQSGAIRVLVTGSGPTVVGIFPGRDGVDRAERTAGALRADFPLVSVAEPVVSDQLERVRS